MHILEVTKEKQGGGTYASLTPTLASQYKLSLLINKLGIEDAVPEHQMHCTVTYSRKHCDGLEASYAKLPITAKATGFKLLGDAPGKGALVVNLDCPGADKLFNDIKTDFGATYDYPEYIAHITLTYAWADKDLPDDSLVAGTEIEFDEFEVTELDTDWKDNNLEESVPFAQTEQRKEVR